MLNPSPMASNLISCACNEGYIKIPKEEVQRVSEFVNAWRFEKSDLLRQCGSSCPFPICLCCTHLLHLAVPELHPFRINQSLSHV